MFRDSALIRWSLAVCMSPRRKIKQDISPGQELLRIPLRIALTDHPDDEESNSLLYEVGMPESPVSLSSIKLGWE